MMTQFMTSIVTETSENVTATQSHITSTGTVINKVTTAVDLTKKITISQIYVHSLLQNNFDQFSQMKSFLQLYSLPSTLSSQIRYL